MNMKSLIVVCLVALFSFTAIAADKAPAAKAKAPSQRIVATYFHGDVRCATCRKIEAYSKEALDEGFAREIAAGTVVFQAINTDRAENKHYVQDYKLMMKSLIIAKEKDGKVTDWVNLPKIWQFTGNQDEFMAYVREGVQSYLDAK
ncbi:MAG: nitrophenyl compound nitroreductase subunit ArsF family protein [Thermoanaerobaculia bacterium]